MFNTINKDNLMYVCDQEEFNEIHIVFNEIHSKDSKMLDVYNNCCKIVNLLNIEDFANVSKPYLSMKTTNNGDCNVTTVRVIIRSKTVYERVSKAKLFLIKYKENFLVNVLQYGKNTVICPMFTDDCPDSIFEVTNQINCIKKWR